MIAPLGKSAGYLLVAALLVGCAGAAGPVKLNLAGVRAGADFSDLAAVLAGTVTDDGRFRPADLKRLMPRLDAQLGKMAIAGPTATPELFITHASRWAYWHNARAAWSLKLAALVECCRRPGPWAMDRAFVLDARIMSLAAIDRLLLAEAGRTGNFRLAACAPGATLGAAPLPGEPFRPEKLAEQLDRAFNQLVEDERRFVLDVPGKRALLPGMLWACRKMVRERYRAEYGSRDAALLTALRPYVGRAGRARLEQALGYTPVERPRLVELAIPRRKVFHPGKVGRVEP